MRSVEPSAQMLEYQSPLNAPRPKTDMGPIEQRIQIGIAIVVLIALGMFVLMILIVIVALKRHV